MLKSLSTAMFAVAILAAPAFAQAPDNSATSPPQNATKSELTGKPTKPSSHRGRVHASHHQTHTLRSRHGADQNHPKQIKRVAHLKKPQATATKVNFRHIPSKPSA